ncbi:MAG: cupin domain-containing protein, partial [Nioella sp.]
MTADQIIAELELAPHPEGGHYRQTWAAGNDGRPTATCIYFLLTADEVSHWHRVDAAEIWLYHAGAPLVLSISDTEAGPAQDHLLTPDLAQGRPQAFFLLLHESKKKCSAPSCTWVISIREVLPDGSLIRANCP